MNVVWFKKDLRIEDHRALRESVENGPTIALFIYEDEWFQSPQFSSFHLQFVEECINELTNSLRKINIQLVVRRGSAVRVFSDLINKYQIDGVYSHRETGLDWTFKRDLKIKSILKSSGIGWMEFDQFAVIRGLKNRDTWNGSRKVIINRKPIDEPKLQVNSPKTKSFSPFDLPKYNYNSNLQRGGRSVGLEYLESFLSSRGQNYTYEMSSPNTAFNSCSRLSPYIAWGCLSMSEIQCAIDSKRAELSMRSDQESRAWFSSLKSFESRLWWHCHFIQKLESEPEIEFSNINRGFDGMRENDFCEEKFQAWCAGETGFPFIDACMRALKTHGWINFRMRAMLISFASFQLWLHWKKTSNHLAKYFLDFEPGIHYSQIQMQSGVTGINTIRIYSPDKQTADQDPEGRFIYKYCPELEGLDYKYFYNFENTPPMILSLADIELGKNYPRSIVDGKISYSEARDKIHRWRKSEKVRELATQVLVKHGSRKNSFFPKQHRKAFGNLNSRTGADE